MMERRISSFRNNPEGFTPVRRRLSTINTRQPHDSEKDWTAARCNRLLRALKSRLAILNKDLLRMQANSQFRDARNEGKAGTTRKADQDTDTDWTQARKRVKRTYSTRDGRNNHSARGSSQSSEQMLASKETRPFIPGQILIPTPILNRARRGIIVNSSSAAPPLVIDGQGLRINKRTKSKNGQSSAQLSETLRDIRKQTPANRYTIYEGIYNGLEALLKATIPEEAQKKRSGSKSLLALCLETVPRYISQEEEHFMVHTEETKSKSALNIRDISTEIYDDLEAFGSNGKGWKHLRVIVRSHGIQVVNDAIRAGSLDAEFVGVLVTLCIHTQATKEAELLLSSLLSTVKMPGPKSVFTRFADEPRTRSLSMLRNYVEITGTYSFQFRQLSAMVSGSLLPVSWLATKELGSIWTTAIQALSTGSDNTDALIFMDTVLPLLAQSRPLAWDEQHGANGDGVMADATKQTFSSLLTTIASIVILSEDTVKQTQAHLSAPTADYEHFVTLMRSCSIQWKLSHDFGMQDTLLVVTNLILQEAGHNSPGVEFNLVDILLNNFRQMAKSSTILPSYHEVVRFICSVARCCGRGASSSGFEHLQKLHQILEGILCGRESDGYNTLREVLADSALAFAQEVPDRKHLDYAAEMEGKVHRIETKPSASLTPGHSLDSSRVGFRWEEGISEWVSATPGVSADKCKQLTEVPRADQSLCETPFHHSMRRRFDKSTPLYTRARMLRWSESGTVTYRDHHILSSPANEHSASELDEDSGDEVVSDVSPEDDALSYSDSEDDLVNDDSLGISSANGVDASGDELASESVQEDLSNDEDSADELQPSSPQVDFSDNSKLSQASSPQREDSFVDKPFTSIASSAISHDGSQPGIGRRYIDRVPRLSRRVLQHSLHWQLFDDSDDELSFVTASSEGESVLQDLTNNAGPSIRRPRRTKTATKHRSLGAIGKSLLSDSEDELCI